tara:strand:- start:32 stop:427 length:396 start_codon:yes stop_codon:yes gene_type:complete
MARITVEDCLEKVENRFHLVRVASKRARQIMNGKEPTLSWDNDKATVLALREIAAGNITEEMLDEKPIVNDDEAIFGQSEIDEEIGTLLSEGDSEGGNQLEASSEEESLEEKSLEENSIDTNSKEPEEEPI